MKGSHTGTGGGPALFQAMTLRAEFKQKLAELEDKKPCSPT